MDSYVYVYKHIIFITLFLDAQLFFTIHWFDYLYKTLVEVTQLSL